MPLARGGEGACLGEIIQYLGTWNVCLIIIILRHLLTGVFGDTQFAFLVNFVCCQQPVCRPS